MLTDSSLLTSRRQRHCDVPLEPTRSSTISADVRAPPPMLWQVQASNAPLVGNDLPIFREVSSKSNNIIPKFSFRGDLILLGVRTLWAAVCFLLCEWLTDSSTQIRHVSARIKHESRINGYCNCFCTLCGLCRLPTGLNCFLWSRLLYDPWCISYLQPFTNC